MFHAEVIEDSIGSRPTDVRLTTVAATYPRIMLAEQNTHRVFSRNTASSRAIPVRTRCEALEANPFIPEAFGKNQKGMQSETLLDEDDNATATLIWKEALADALRHARRLEALQVHKEYANRLIEPFSWVTQLITATSWDNYFNLRIHRHAQREIKKLATLIRETMQNSTPRVITVREYSNVASWHLPYVTLDERQSNLPVETLARVSASRCAAVSYEKHNQRKLIEDELAKCEKLLASNHLSPVEHQAVLLDSAPALPSNFTGNWHQFRKSFANENIFPGEE